MGGQGAPSGAHTVVRIQLTEGPLSALDSQQWERLRYVPNGIVTTFWDVGAQDP